MRIPAIVAALLLLAQPAQSAEGLKDCLERAAARLDFSGVARVETGSDVVEESFGAADANGRIPVQAATRFNIASAGKMFTAVAIGQLVDRGLVSFDAPVGAYIGGLRPEISRITVRQLMAHTSGLGDYLDPVHHDLIDQARTATALLPLATADAPAFQPGSRFGYSNSGYVVLGAIVESVSHETFAEYLEREIFARAQMNDTTLDDEGGADPLTRISPGGRLEKPVVSPLRLAFASPAGGELSTASDVARFLTALQSGRLVHATTRAELFTPQAGRGGSPRYGLGFDFIAGPPLRVGHGGGAPGINAEIALFPETNRQIVVLSNTDPPAASRLEAVLEHVLFSADKTPRSCDLAIGNAALMARPAPPGAR